MSNYKVEITGINTSNLKCLSHKENIELFKQLNSGDESAKEKLVNGNLKLVLSILKKYNKRNVNMDDLFQVGVVGLIKAIDNFDITYNLKLSTYGVPLILGEIKKYIRDDTTYRISRGIKDNAYQILKYKEEFFQKNGFDPSDEDIAKHLGITTYDVRIAIESLREPISINEPIYNDGFDPIYLEEHIADNRSSGDLDVNIMLHRAINKIGEREKFVILQRYVIGKTQTEIAHSLDLSQAQVSRIEKNALRKLRNYIK